jgi:hypothetical protein
MGGIKRVLICVAGGLTPFGIIALGYVAALAPAWLIIVLGGLILFVAGAWIADNSYWRS